MWGYRILIPSFLSEVSAPDIKWWHQNGYFHEGRMGHLLHGLPMVPVAGSMSAPPPPPEQHIIIILCLLRNPESALLLCQFKIHQLTRKLLLGEKKDHISQPIHVLDSIAALHMLPGEHIIAVLAVWVNRHPTANGPELLHAHCCVNPSISKA